MAVKATTEKVLRVGVDVGGTNTDWYVFASLPLYDPQH